MECRDPKKDEAQQPHLDGNGGLERRPLVGHALSSVTTVPMTMETIMSVIDATARTAGMLQVFAWTWEGGGGVRCCDGVGVGIRIHLAIHERHKQQLATAPHLS